MLFHIQKLQLIQMQRIIMQPGVNEGNTHSVLILAHSEEGRTFYFLSLAMDDLMIISALYQLWKSQTCWKT